MRNRLLLFTFFPVLFACHPDASLKEDVQDMSSLKVPRGFTFSTLSNSSVRLQAYAPDGAPLRFVPFLLGYDLPNGERMELGRYATDAAGQVVVDVLLPSIDLQLFVETTYPGLPSRTDLGRPGARLEKTLGAASAAKAAPASAPDGTQTAAFSQNGYWMMGTWSASGVPNYLVTPRDVISQTLLNDINASLPETRPVPTWHPEYLTGADLDTRLTDLCDVWVTFVHEGAGWVNALGYYTYDLKAPPASAAAIDTLHIIFPNVSFTGSGGGLTSGDKVYLGRFPPNTGIGWFLIPNGWDAGTRTVKSIGSITQGVKYSNQNFNTYAASASRQHFIALKDNARELILLGFEDTTRPGGDNDFNDAIFYVSANPFKAINTSNLVEVEIAQDTDNDGVFDHQDNYPADAARAYDTYFPGSGKFGSLAFEDLWPIQGDYDFNDLVVDYNYHFVTDAQNRVKDVDATWRTKAVGGRHRNGLAFVLNVPPSGVASTTGQQLFGGMVQRAANGTETGQSKSVVFVYDDAYRIISPPSGFSLVNAEPLAPAVPAVDTRVIVTLQDPVASATLGTAPYNPFIASNQRRGYEIHLMNQPPTDKADPGLFGTGDDASTLPAVTYRTATGLPWAIHTPAAFVQPYENQSVLLGHLKFRDWAESGGSLFADWYQAKSGYRNNAVLWK